METAVEKKKMGNPNFGKSKKDSGKVDPKKRYVFILTETHEKAKGRDSKTGEVTHNPYPPIYFIPNEGVAFDETGKQRRWRYVYGYDSIWVDEQLTPEPSVQQLRSDRNSLTFRDGHLGIMGHDLAKLKALLVQDGYEGNDNPIEQKPKLFRLINEDQELEKLESNIDSEYEALKIATEYKMEDLLPSAMALGINIDNWEENQAKIRAQFKLKAKQMPSFILNQIQNPKIEINYVFTLGLQKNIISSSIVENKLVMVESGLALLEVNSSGDVADQLSTKVISQDETATKVYDTLKRLIK